MGLFESKEERNTECITSMKQDVAVLKVEVKHLGDGYNGLTQEVHALKRSVDDGNKELMERLDRNHEKVMTRMDGNFIKIDNRIDETNVRIDTHELFDAKDHGFVKGMVWILGSVVTLITLVGGTGIHFNWW